MPTAPRRWHRPSCICRATTSRANSWAMRSALPVAPYCGTSTVRWSASAGWTCAAAAAIPETKGWPSFFCSDMDRAASPARSGTARVLVVDDDECLRELLNLHLWQAGYDVRLAEDAIEAGRMVLKAVPDLMIVDINLPYMNGFE